MTLREYIESGILERYALGELDASQTALVTDALAAHPALNDELRRIETILEERAARQAISPPPHLKHTVLEAIRNKEKERRMDPEDLPLLNRHSDHTAWLRLLQAEIQAPAAGERVEKVLRHSPEVVQVFVVSTTDIDEEQHDDLYESFLILEGTCRCVVSGNVFDMKAGDLMEIPLHEMHHVTVTSPYVAAVLQHRML